VKVAERYQPATIMLDLLMPGLNGFETIAALQERESTREIPVVVYSVLDRDGMSGPTPEVSDWVTKLAGPETIARSLEKALAGGGKPKRVLLVEDDPDLARVMTETLTRQGIQTFHARSGREAVEMSQRLEPDLLVLDLVLPEGDGFTVVDLLRRHDRLRAVPLIIYSAMDLDSSARRRLQLGPTEFLTKGRINPEEVERRVLDLLGRIIDSRREEADRV